MVLQFVMEVFSSLVCQLPGFGASPCESNSLVLILMSRVSSSGFAAMLFQFVMKIFSSLVCQLPGFGSSPCESNTFALILMIFTFLFCLTRAVSAPLFVYPFGKCNNFVTFQERFSKSGMTEQSQQIEEGMNSLKRSSTGGGGGEGSCSSSAKKSFLDILKSKDDEELPPPMTPTSIHCTQGVPHRLSPNKDLYVKLYQKADKTRLTILTMYVRNGVLQRGNGNKDYYASLDPDEYQSLVDLQQTLGDEAIEVIREEQKRVQQAELYDQHKKSFRYGGNK